ncbi:hypothetical protein [Aquicella siphonis]|nr:hypothetical protein [Aquicella siphonis]
MKRLLFFLFLLWMASASAQSAQVLVPCQYLKTSGARDITPFELNGAHFIAVSQLAADVEGLPANMNGGNADVPVIIYQWREGKFVEYQRIPGHGNEGAEFFTIGKRAFLAVASIESGPAPPFNLHSYSMIYEWDGKRFFPFQQFYAYASKSWKFFSIGKRHFLALANGVVPPASKAQADTSSTLFEWNGSRFEKFQSFPTKWAYGWSYFTIDGVHYLGLTDHLQSSSLYRWEKGKFVLFQAFTQPGGRSFRYFAIDGRHYLAFANISHASEIFLWNGKRFESYQTLNGAGGRNFTFFESGENKYLFQTRFITGQRANPETVLLSPLYLWKNHRFKTIQTITTYGGVNSAIIKTDDGMFLAVANSLAADQKFRVDSVIYKINS